MANSEQPEKLGVRTVTDFFERLYTGEQLQPVVEFRGVPLKDRRPMICDCCGDGDDCCGFN